MKFVVGENGRNPAKNLPRPRTVHHETHMEGPRRELGTPAVGGERLTACATRPPFHYSLKSDREFLESLHFAKRLCSYLVTSKCARVYVFNTSAIN